MKRQRGRGRKPGHHNSPNRSFDSAGPDVKVRGSATHVYERYLQLARDAASSGDRVVAENYLQHAEHYYRILRATQPLQPRPEIEHRYPGDFDEGDDEEGEYEAEGVEASREPVREQQAPREGYTRERDGRGGREPREHREPRAEARQPREQREQPREPREPRFERPREARSNDPGAEGAEPGFEPPTTDREGGDPAFRRRRSRRRFRSGEAREPGTESDHDAPVEGFGDQLPAFVASE